MITVSFATATLPPPIGQTMIQTNQHNTRYKLECMSLPSTLLQCYNHNAIYSVQDKPGAAISSGQTCWTKSTLAATTKIHNLKHTFQIPFFSQLTVFSLLFLKLRATKLLINLDPSNGRMEVIWLLSAESSLKFWYVSPVLINSKDEIWKEKV